MYWRVFAASALVLASACAAGAPLGFNKGTNWTIPLVEPLGDGIPLAWVTIDGNGPYLFAVNLDADSMIDPALSRQLGLWETRVDWQKARDDSDEPVLHQLVYADVFRLSAGDLTVSQRQLIVLGTGASHRGQPVLGVLGRDILSNILIWTLDRDRALLSLATQGHQPPPPDARRVPLTTRHGAVFVAAHLEDRVPARLRVLFHGTSRIWPDLAAQAALARLDLPGNGTQEAWLASTVQLGELRAEGVTFAAFQDRRVRRVDHDGVLGRELWSRYRITVNLHQGVMWLEPRPATPAIPPAPGESPRPQGAAPKPR